uniref:Uncharacterized protein n=1 Tax=Lepeophtheirus salmonis TaxID=72036 RepID=A0A0K2T2G6_LEPSM
MHLWAEIISGNSSLSPPTRKETSEQIPGIMNKCVCVVISTRNEQAINEQTLY